MKTTINKLLEIVKESIVRHNRFLRLGRRKSAKKRFFFSYIYQRKKEKDYGEDYGNHIPKGCLPKFFRNWNDPNLRF